MPSMLSDAFQLLNERPHWPKDREAFRFFVSEHQATRHHFDIGLLAGNHFLTWAVGNLSMDPSVIIEAVETGLHPLASEDSERYIPAGQKGSGPKIIWDRGLYRPEDMDYRSVLSDLRKNFLQIQLFGNKLKGGWTLKPMGFRKWTFQKIVDEYATSENILLKNRSVKSGQRLKDLDIGPVGSVKIEGFYAAHHPSKRPVIVTRDGRVLDCNLLATKRKIRIGMTDREARNILADGEIIPWNPSTYEARRRAWLDICLEFTDVIEPVQQHWVYIDLSLHPQPYDAAQELRRTLHKRLDLPVRVGVAKAKWVADLDADLGQDSTALKDPKRFVAALSIEDLTPIDSEIRNKLMFLGYNTIGEIQELGYNLVQEQFGEQVHGIKQAARGSYCEHVKPSYPLDAIVDRFVFQGAVESSEAIREACETWSQNIGQTLQKKSIAGTKVKLTLEFENGDLKTISRIFAKPIQCARTAFVALLHTLDGQIDQPLVSIRLHLMDLQRVSLYQPSLFTLVTKDEERIRPTLNHLRTMFGDGSIELGSQKQEPRRVQVLRMWRHATGWQ